jgi:urea carboxylase
MFDTVLIANRGEIACRAIRTLRRMGLRSVAVYSTADAQSLHVAQADVAVHIGEAVAKESYLDMEKLLRVARETGAGAVFPGYGFLSENTEFAARCAEQGIVFIGPRPEHIVDFGLKHRARELASAAQVPLTPGSGLLADVEEAKLRALEIGYPVMLKSTGGGGGIGLLPCANAEELERNFATTERLGRSNFGTSGVFVEKLVERARHIEVQIFGDGSGRVVALGLRDCSAQRRNQKVVEEAPAPNLPASVVAEIQRAAVRLGEGCRYLSAGTVEFVYDVDGGAFYFLEVNTRLQVEHGVTELVFDLDLVEWMVLTAQGKPPDLAEFEPLPTGHAIEARLYAEAPDRNFQPSSGLLTSVDFGPDVDGVRVDTWVETGVEVSPYYDPLLAKVMAYGKTREQAIERLVLALRNTQLEGVDTNLDFVGSVLQSAAFRTGELTTRALSFISAPTQGLLVIDAGTFSTVQDWPGRLGFWDVGIPPSGAMDGWALRLGNRVVGNPEGAAGIEMTMRGMTLVFREPTTIALAGADMGARLDGQRVPRYAPLDVESGQRLELGSVEGPGARAYLCVRNGLRVPAYLGSSATFTLGRFGGHAGRALAPGDVLKVAWAGAVDVARPLSASFWPTLTKDWEIGVMPGPQGAPDFFTEDDIDTFFATRWEVHYNSARTGVRLIGPKPAWARPDGGEAGLHPSNIHDNAYAFGAVDYTGDMPIVLGPDGPSLGGFVCPATVVQSELWKLGQLAPGNHVRFVPVELDSATKREVGGDNAIRSLDLFPELEIAPRRVAPVVRTRTPDTTPKVTYRCAGDRFLLVEYGEMVLDLELRFRVHALTTWLAALALPGIIDTTPGIRSLLVHYDSRLLSRARLIDTLEAAEQELPSAEHLRVPTRIVNLPLSWDDEATQLAIRKYTQLVRKDAPWAPSNIEFIRRINGLRDEQAVKDIVYGAAYLVLGLGDVYLGAPVATPIDPRHRLVTTKYNPARTWTPENAVGIGGAYMCIYGMEGPGGYQFVGRTLQVYNRFRTTRDFQKGKPWLLRFFDQIRFYPVSSADLLRLRDAFPAGRHTLDIQEEEFDLASYRRTLLVERESIGSFKTTQQRAFEAERARWVADGQLHFESTPESVPHSDEVPAGLTGVRSPVPGSVWQIAVRPEARVRAGQKLVVLESMKMEIAVESSFDGTVVEVRVQEGQAVGAGQVLVVVAPDRA